MHSRYNMLFVFCRYADLVEGLFEYYCAPSLGLLRVCNEEHAPPVVVLANPRASMTVEASDRVFVLVNANIGHSLGEAAGMP